MTSWPWILPKPWYVKVWRVFHCVMSIVGHIVYMDYLIDDLKKINAKLSCAQIEKEEK